MVDVTFPILQGGGVRSTSYHDVCINYLFRVSFWRLWLENEKAKEREREREQKEKTKKENNMSLVSPLIYLYSYRQSLVSCPMDKKREGKRDRKNMDGAKRKKKDNRNIANFFGTPNTLPVFVCEYLFNSTITSPPTLSILAIIYEREFMLQTQRHIRYRHTAWENLTFSQ